MVDATTVRVTFLGTSSVYVDDGATAILVDGFLSRPSLLRVALGRIAPDAGRISRALTRAGISRLDALLVAHSHHDHVMDAPEIVRRLGGVMHGSASTLNVGRGWGLDEGAMALVRDGQELAVGAFTVRVLEGEHSPGNRYPGTIDEPLVPPARARAYRDGGYFSFHIAHPTGALLVHPSAHVVPHQFDDLQVDALYLGVGAVGAQPEQFRDHYWHHVVEAVRPSVIVPIHWDDFFRSLDRDLRPMPSFLDRFDRTRAWLDRRSAESGIPVRFQQPFEVIEPLV